MPAEFLNANFGEEIKERLLRTVQPAALMVFAPSVTLFEEALTTSVIVLFEKARSQNAPAWVKRVDSVEEAQYFAAKLLAGTPVRAGDGCLAMHDAQSPRQVAQLAVQRKVAD